MNDMYREILVAKQKTAMDTVKVFVTVALTAVLAVAGLLITPVALIAAILAGVGAWFAINGSNIEYEYQYVNGDIDVDRISNKSRRKRVASFDIANLEILARTGSHDLDSYKDRKEMKRFDFTDGREETRSWTGIYNGTGSFTEVKLELDEEIVNDMRRYAPRKVLVNS